MSKYITLFLLALIATSLAAPRGRVNVNTQQKADLKWWNESKAQILTSRSFEGLVGKEKYVVVQFCATFSKECEALQPEYNKLAEMYSGANPKHNNVFIGKIDGWTFNSLSQTYGVKRFPTIRFFNKNDATNSDEYSGDTHADSISKWIEDLIKAKESTKTEEKKPEEPKKEEPAGEAPKQPEATNTQQNNQQQQQQQQTQQTQQNQQQQPPKTEEDIKKEFKLVLNTTLLQAQFDEVQNQLNKLNDALSRNIAENFKKVESLSQSFENHKRDFDQLTTTLRGQSEKLNNIGNTLNVHKDEIKSSVTRHAEEHLTSLKDTVSSIKNKVHEKKIEEPSGPGFMHNLIYMIIGGAVGAGIMFAMGGGNKKKRSMLD